MKIGSLFSGIGGLEMGLEACGLGPVAWQCDIDPESRAALAEHWPNAKRYDDVRAIDEKAERVDIICGGFPCQPISLAGKQKGKADTRWLWPFFADIIRRLRPSAVFVENVPALRTSGLRDVLADLARLGFDARWDCFSSCEVGAAHSRRRLFLLAHADSIDGQIRLGSRSQPGPQTPGDRGESGAVPALRVASWCPIPLMADGLPRRLARLPGNAVDPRVAELAFRELSGRFGERGRFCA